MKLVPVKVKENHLIRFDRITESNENTKKKKNATDKVSNNEKKNIIHTDIVLDKSMEKARKSEQKMVYEKKVDNKENQKENVHENENIAGKDVKKDNKSVKKIEKLTGNDESLTLTSKSKTIVATNSTENETKILKIAETAIELQKKMTGTKDLFSPDLLASESDVQERKRSRDNIPGSSDISHNGSSNKKKGNDSVNNQKKQKGDSEEKKRKFPTAIQSRENNVHDNENNDNDDDQTDDTNVDDNNCSDNDLDKTDTDFSFYVPSSPIIKISKKNPSSSSFLSNNISLPLPSAVPTLDMKNKKNKNDLRNTESTEYVITGIQSKSKSQNNNNQKSQLDENSSNKKRKSIILDDDESEEEEEEIEFSEDQNKNLEKSKKSKDSGAKNLNKNHPISSKYGSLSSSSSSSSSLSSSSSSSKKIVTKNRINNSNSRNTSVESDHSIDEIEDDDQDTSRGSTIPKGTGRARADSPSW